MILTNSVLLGVPLHCKLLSLQVRVVQLLEPPLLKVVVREAGDQAGEAEAEVVSGVGVGEEVLVQKTAMCVQANKLRDIW